jgi:hypothetical protein
MPEPLAAGVNPGGYDLTGMSPGEFDALVRANLGREADAALWDALTAPVVIHRTKDCLAAIITDLVMQLQRANAELDEFQAECLARGEEGKAAFLAAKAEQANWRRRISGYRRLVEQRMAFVKSRIRRDAQPRSPFGAGFTKNARKHNRASLEKLASAVAEHRRRVTSGDGDEDDDEALWACLEDITAITSAGEELPLGEWLEYLDDAREGEQ